MVSQRALHVKVGGRSVKFKRSERLKSNPHMAKKMTRKSHATKTTKTPATRKRPPLTALQVEARKARERRARGAQPERKKHMESILGQFGCIRSDQFIMTGTVVSYIPPFKKATHIAKGRLHAVTRQVGYGGELWAIIKPIREKTMITVDLCDVYSPLPGKGHYQLLT